jgi:hypothetical protein
MPDDQQLSAQDMSDLREIATHLPTGHPMQGKLSKLLNSQPTQFEKDRPGSGNLLEGAGTAAWEGIKGIGKGIVNSLDPTQGLSGAGLSAVGLNPRSGSASQRLNEIPIVGAAREARSALQDPNSGFLDKVAAGPGALVGMSDESARGHAARGESGAIVGEAAAPIAMALSPVLSKAIPSRASVGMALRDEAGALKPAVRATARIAGAGLGHLSGIPGMGELGGFLAGPPLADALIPKRPFDIPTKGMSFGAPFPQADEFYANRGENLMRRGEQQDSLDRNQGLKPKPVDPFAGMTPTDKPVGNAEVPSFRGPSAPPPTVEYANKYGSSSSRPTEGLIVRHDSPPPPRQVTYQSAAQPDLLKKVMSGDRDAIAEWDRRSLPRPPGVGFMVEPGAPNIPWGKPR